MKSVAPKVLMTYGENAKHGGHGGHSTLRVADAFLQIDLPGPRLKNVCDTSRRVVCRSPSRAAGVCRAAAPTFDHGKRSPRVTARSGAQITGRP